MKWRDLINTIKFFEKKGNAEFEVQGVELDSRMINEGYIFIAAKGITSDGHEYIDRAIASGALGIVCTEWPSKLNEAISYVQVEDSIIAAGLLADTFYDHPSRHLKLIGVTGTNGKTTTVTMLYRLVKAFGYKAGLLSTVRNYIHDQEVYATHTTPDAIRINELLARMVAAGCAYAFMEVSSHAMKQNRVAGLQFSGGVFSNLTH